jgi:hypothetical protein
LATSGSQSSGALTAATTFSLSCVGDGVTTTASTSVSISSTSGGHGGGGGFTFSTLLALLGALMLRRGFNGWRYRE